MYPNLYYALKDWFGISWNPLRFVNSFGMIVVISFFVAMWAVGAELRRKAKEGVLGYEEETVIIGMPPSLLNLLPDFLFGFLFGYKFIGIFFSASGNSQDYILSLAGSWPAGLVLGLAYAGLKWYEVYKQKLPEPVEKTVRVWPHDRIGTLAFLAAIFGFGGAKIFNSLENWDDFVREPFQSLFSFSGLTFYGGLICAALAIWWYAKRHHIPFWQLNDAAAPGLMIAYAVGRIGCQVSGDGDWGIPNSAYLSRADGKVFRATANEFQNTMQQNQAYVEYVFGSEGNVRHYSVHAPSFLPDWLFAYPYPHNVNDIGLRLFGCTGEHCAYLPLPVFPTPIYETIAGTLIFFLLWSLRKRLPIPGTLFSLYLILNGIERFFIEQIRVNTRYNLFGLKPTQAELIALALVIGGAACYILLSRKAKTLP